MIELLSDAVVFLNHVHTCDRTLKGLHDTVVSSTMFTHVTELTQGYPVCGGLAVDPEGHPGEDDQQATREVEVYQEVPGVSAQLEGHTQHRVWGWRQKHGWVDV